MKKPGLVAAALLSMLVISTVGWAQDTDQTRFYLGGRLGAGFFLSDGPPGGVKWAATISDTVAESFGAVVGLNFDKHFGAEIAIDYREAGLTVPGLGKIGEYSVFSIIPQLRVRYPLENGKLSPYFIAGVGFARTEFNDPTTKSSSFAFSGTDDSVVGSLGAGVTYFVANNISLDLEAKFLLGEADVQVGGQTQQANLNTALLLFGIRIYFPEAKTAPTD